MNFTNVAEKRISNNVKLINQINLITRCEDNITKYFQSISGIFHESSISWTQESATTIMCQKKVSQSFSFKQFTLALSSFRAS